MTEFRLEQVVQDAEEALSQHDREMHLVSLPYYVASNVHTTLLVLRETPGIMRIIEAVSPGLGFEPNTDLGADVLSVLCDSFSEAMRKSKIRVSVPLSLAELFAYAK